MPDNLIDKFWTKFIIHSAVKRDSGQNGEVMRILRNSQKVIEEISVTCQLMTFWTRSNAALEKTTGHWMIWTMIFSIMWKLIWPSKRTGSCPNRKNLLITSLFFWRFMYGSNANLEKWGFIQMFIIFWSTEPYSPVNSDLICQYFQIFIRHVLEIGWFQRHSPISWNWWNLDWRR